MKIWLNQREEERKGRKERKIVRKKRVEK